MARNAASSSRPAADATDLPASHASPPSTDPHSPSQPFSAHELATLEHWTRFWPRGDPRWSNERFVDGVIMGQLRGRAVWEIMAWGSQTHDRAQNGTRGHLYDGPRLPQQQQSHSTRLSAVELSQVAASTVPLPEATPSEVDDQHDFYPANLPSTLPRRDITRAVSVSSAASNSRLFSRSVDAFANEAPPVQRVASGTRARVVSSTRAAPSPLVHAQPTVLSPPPAPRRPSGRYAAPETLSSWAPSTFSPPTAAQLAFPTSEFDEADDEAEEIDAPQDVGQVAALQSQLSEVLSNPDIPPDVRSQVSFSFSDARRSTGEHVPDPQAILRRQVGTDDRGAILLLPAAQRPSAAPALARELQQALDLLSRCGYVANQGNAGETGPPGGTRRWVFVPSTARAPENVSGEDALANEDELPEHNADSQSAANASPIAGPSRTRQPSARGRPANRGRPTTRAATAAARSRTDSNVSPATSTRSRTAAAAAAQAARTGEGGSPASSPTKSASVRSRSPSESPRPTRRARTAGGSSVTSFTSYVSSTKTSSVSGSTSQRRLPTPSPELSDDAPLQLPELDEMEPAPDTPPLTSEEDLPIAQRRVPRSTTGRGGGSSHGGTSSAGSSLRLAGDSNGRTRTNSNASSTFSFVAPPLACEPLTTPSSPVPAASSSVGPTRRNSTRSMRSLVGESSPGVSLRRARTNTAPPAEVTPSARSSLLLNRARRSTAVVSGGSVRHLHIPAANTIEGDSPATETSDPPAVRPFRGFLPFSTRPRASTPTALTRPPPPRPAPSAIPRTFNFSSLAPAPSSPGSSAAFSVISSEGELPLDANPPPAYSPAFAGAEFIPPPPRRRSTRPQMAQAAVQAPARPAQAQPRGESALAQRLFGNFGRR